MTGIPGGFNDSFAKQIAELAVKGRTLPQIAHDLGVKVSAVQSMAYRRGIAITGPGAGNRRGRVPRERQGIWSMINVVDREFDE